MNGSGGDEADEEKYIHMHPGRTPPWCPLTHTRPFHKNCMHIENLGGDISHPALQNRRLIIGCFLWKFQGGEAAFACVVAFDGEWPKEI